MTTPLLLAIRQLPDPAFRTPLLRAAALAALAFGLLAWGAARGAAALAAAAPDWLAWPWVEALAQALGGLAALATAWWFFVPVVVVLAGLFLDPVAAAVERRHYPGLPPARGAGVAAQVAWTLRFGLLLLLLHLLVLPLVVLLPGLGALLAWLLAGWGLGTGLVEGVAQRRLPVAAARQLRRRLQGRVLLLGLALSAGATLPVVNLLVPVLGTAAAVHLLHRSGGGRIEDSRG